MNTFTLIIMMHVGPLGAGNSNALTNVTGFKTAAACEVAARATKKLAEGTVKEIETVCVEIK